MSLLHLVNKNVIIKFADVAKSQFNPEASYAFRLTGVDAMGFLQIQDLIAGHPAAPETSAEPYWINKDLVREIREGDLTAVKETVLYTGVSVKPQPEPAKPQAEPVTGDVPRELAPKASKAKAPAKPKTALKQKPIFN
jgi:hypothetical protein